MSDEWRLRDEEWPPDAAPAPRDGEAPDAADTITLPASAVSPATQRLPRLTPHSPGLSRAVHATASPRRGLSIGGYERVGARRERQRLAVAASAVALGLLVLLLFFLWERSKAAGVTYSHWGPLGSSAGDDYDEGAYVLSAQLLLKGYALFSSVFSAQPAFFLPSLAAVMRVVSDPDVAAHLYEVLFGLATLLGVFWMAWTAYRPLAAPLAAALLAVSPGFLLYAHAVEAEMPMLGLCTLAVAAAQSYYQTQRRLMAALAGLLLIAGTEMKLLSVVVALPMVMLLLGGAYHAYARRGRRAAGKRLGAILLDALVFVLCLVVPALLVLGLLSPAQQWRQVITFHLAAGTGAADTAANLQALWTYLAYDIGLLVVAVVGALIGLFYARGRYLPLVYALWFLSTLLFLWRYHPLFQHQFVPLLPPLALLGAALAAPLRAHALAAGRPRYVEGQAFRPAPARSTLWRRLAPAVIGLSAVAYLALLGFRTLSLDRHLFAPPVTPNRDLLIAWLDRSTRPGDFVVCDDPMIALGAHRLLPPGLEDPSRVRTTSGYLTVDEAVATTQRYHVAAIIASRPMFSIYLQGYLAWAAQHYRPVSSSAPGTQVYLRK